MATPSTSTKLLADLLLEQGQGRDLAAFVRERRPEKSWRIIARELYEATDRKVDVTSQTLRSWFGDGERGGRHRSAAPPRQRAG